MPSKKPLPKKNDFMAVFAKIKGIGSLGKSVPQKTLTNTYGKK